MIMSKIDLDIGFDCALRGMRRRRRAQRPAMESNLIDCLNRAGARLYGDRAGAPDSVRRYADMKRHRLVWAGDCNCLTRHIFC